MVAACILHKRPGYKNPAYFAPNRGKSTGCTMGDYPTIFRSRWQDVILPDLARATWAKKKKSGTHAYTRGHDKKRR
jgi:hypothetical protein